MLYSTDDLLSSLSQRGVKLWVENGQLCFQALRGHILPEELNQLRVQKAEIIDLLRQAQSASEPPLEPRSVGCVIPLTAFQLGWLNYLKENKELSWRMCISAVRVSGPLDASLLQSSVEAVVQRHESLRTRIVAIDGIPRQQIDAACDHHFELVDLSEMSCPVTEEYVSRLADEFAEEKFDLSVGPLFATKLFRLSRRDHVLILALDHIISDAESNAILCAELWDLYIHAAQSLPLSRSQPSAQFADYAVWQQQTYDAWRRNHETYWRQRLSGAPQIQIPTNSGLTSVERPVGVRLMIPFGERLSVRVHDVARRERTLAAIVALTIYTAVMSRWCDQQDLIVSFVSNGRTRQELVNMIGCLAEHIPLRVQMTKEDSFLDLLKRVKEEFEAACEHFPLGRVPDIVPGYTTDINFNWVSNVPPSIASLEQASDAKISIEPFPCFRKPLPFKFGSFFIDSPGGITWMVEYRPDLFTASTVEWVGRNLQLFAEEFVQNPRARLASISMQV